MDVAVEDRDRAEPLEVAERLLAVVRGPAPLRMDGPGGHRGEDDARGAARALPHVVLEPLELLGAQASETFGLVALHVDEADEVHAPVVEALPALAADRALAVAGEVFLAAVEEDVVLAGHVEHAFGLHALEHLRDRVERAS